MKKTQFVIVDNASNDNTEEIINELNGDIKYDILYHKEAVKIIQSYTGIVDKMVWRKF